MADYNLGTASGKIEINGAGASAGFKVARTAADAFFGVFQAKMQHVQSIGRRLAAVGGAGVTGFGLAIKAAANFETQMSGVQAVTGATETQFEALREKALQLGADTSFSASEAGLAIEELGKAGIPIKDILNGAADATVALAAAGGIELPQAATIAANAMNMFSLEASEMGNVADVLAGVANTSASDVAGIGQSLSQAGAVANLAGLSFRDTAIAIGEMADAGITGSDAGTSIKTMLNNLIPVTDKQQRKFEELDLITYDLAKANKVLAAEGLKPEKSMNAVRSSLEKYIDKMGEGNKGTMANKRAQDQLLSNAGAMRNMFFDQAGNVKNLHGLQKTLGDSLKGLTREQKLSTLETLFGADAMRASAILSLAGAEGYDKFSKAVSKVSAAEVAKIRLNNLSGATEAFRGSMETAMITIGSVFLPIITKIVQGATWLVNIFNSLPGPIKTAIAVFALIASTGMLVVGMILALLPVILSMIANFLLMRSLSYVFTFFRSLIAALRAGTLSMAVTRAAAATTGNSFLNLGKKALLGSKMIMFAAKTMQRAWIIATGPIGIAIAVIMALVAIGVLLYKKWTPFRNLVDKIAAILKDKFQAAWAALQPVIAKVVAAFVKFGGFVRSTLMPVITSIAKMLFGKLLTGWKEISSQVMGQLMPALQKLANAFTTQVVPALQKLWTYAQPLVSALGKIAMVVGGVLIGTLMLLGKVFISYILPILMKIVGFLLGVVIDTIVTLVTGIIQAVTGIIKIFTGLINFIAGVFTGDWSRAWNGIKDMFFGILDLIIGVVKVAFSIGLLKAVALGFKLIFAIVRGSWRVILSIFKGAGKGIWSAVKGIFNFIVRIIKGTFRLYWNIIRGGWNLIVKIFKGVGPMLKSLVTRAFNAIVNFFKNSMGEAGNIFQRGWSAIKGATTKAWNGLVDAVRNGITNMIDFVKGIPGKIMDAIGNLATLLKDAGGKLIQGLIDGITGKIGDAIQAVRDGVGKIRDLLPGSPIKEGPLKSWNRGGAGRRLMQTLAYGIERERGKTVQSAKIMAAAIGKGFEDEMGRINPKAVLAFENYGTVRGDRTHRETAALTPRARRPRPARKAGKQSTLRMVSGTLKFDRQGRAYIKGLAQEVVEDNKDFDKNRKGKGRRND